VSSPLFTIGVTTYNRKEMLRECIDSLLGQTFTDFEVIVGNDYTDEAITPGDLGIDDDRVRIINHPLNLGEIGNMNHLLAQARGSYFSWLADDDLVSPRFMQSIREVIEGRPGIECVFCSYSAGAEYDLEGRTQAGSYRVLQGSGFLRLYLQRKIRAIGCYGGFEVEYP